MSDLFRKPTLYFNKFILFMLENNAELTQNKLSTRLLQKYCYDKVYYKSNGERKNPNKSKGERKSLSKIHIASKVCETNRNLSTASCFVFPKNCSTLGLES